MSDVAYRLFEIRLLAASVLIHVLAVGFGSLLFGAEFRPTGIGLGICSTCEFSVARSAGELAV